MDLRPALWWVVDTEEGMIARFKIWRAQRRLQRLVDAQRLSYAAEDYRRRRQAMLKVTRG